MFCTDKPKFKVYKFWYFSYFSKNTGSANYHWNYLAGAIIVSTHSTWAIPNRNWLYDICDLHRPRIACTSLQSDQGLCFLLMACLRFTENVSNWCKSGQTAQGHCLIWVSTGCICHKLISICRGSYVLRGLDTPESFNYFNKTDNFYDFPFAFLHSNPLLKRNLFW